MPTSRSQPFRTLRRTSSTAPLRLVAVGLVEPARRPVRLGRVAAARAVERRDVLERDEDVPVQLDVGNLVHVAVRSEHALLVLAAEESDLDLLTLVLACVVLHRPAVSLSGGSRRLRGT